MYIDTRAPRNILAVLLCATLVLAFTGLRTWAADKSYPGLASGLEILSAYSGAHPKAAEAFDKLLERAPADVQAQVRASKWAETQSKMDKQDLLKAADKGMTIVPTAHGLAAIPNDKLKEGMDALADFAIDQKETEGFVNAIKDDVPEPFKTGLNTISGLLGDLRKKREKGEEEGIWDTGKRIAIKGTASALGNGYIDGLSEGIRNEIYSGNAQKVLDKYKEKAADLRRKAGEKIAAAEAERKKREEAAEAERKKQEAAAEKAAKEKAAEEALEAMKKHANDALADHDKVVAAKEAAVAQCEQIRASIPAAPALTGGPGTFEAGEKATNAINDAIKSADAAGAAENLIRMIGDATQEANSACADPTAFIDKGGSKDSLGTRLDVARGVHSAIRSEIDKALGALDKPVFDRGGVQKFISDIKSFRDWCNKNKDIGTDTASRIPLTQKEKVIQGTIGAYDHYLSGMGSISDLEVVAIRARLASQKTKLQKLEASAKACVQAIDAMNIDCNNQGYDEAVANEAKTIAGLDAADARRAAAQQKLNDLLTRVNDAYSDAKTAVLTGQACVDNAGTDPSKCDQEAIKAAYADANAAYLKENYGLARQKMEAILSKYAGCPGVVDKFTRDDGLIDTMVGGDVKVDTAINDCDVPRLNRQIGIITNSIAKIDSGQTRSLPRTRTILQRWIGRIQAAIEKCTKVASADPNAGGGGSGGGGPGGGGPGTGNTGPGNQPGGGGTGGGGPSGGGPGGPTTVTCPTNTAQAAPGTKSFNMMTGPSSGGGSGGGAAPATNPACGGPCPVLAGWTVSPGVTCLGTGGTTPQPATPPGPQTASTSSPTQPNGSGGFQSDPISNDRPSSGCGPPPTCGCNGVPGGKAVGYTCPNGEWIGGHCVCPIESFNR